MKNYRTENQRLYYDKVISLYRDHHMGRKRIEKIIPLSDHTISKWIRNFVAENPEYKSKRMKMAEEKRKQKAIEDSIQSPLPNDKQSLQSEVARLRKALREASMRADLYDEMINVAEKQFNISIRKKAGTKQ
ncbi:glutamate--cysteine ligase [Prevotella communis]|uniref:glutamate--cysteine ligase n=1 Tax=Prevotella communis TaxID=2913614 RepID=UPI001EDA34A9|nr:glutamate--cysteine ligase [Prevotella communis]UKK62459.1 glutamate--cysteine ligase [Prevotella communis]UKK65284.1 glutamate--cysteine ligase [Prevotella communis]